MQTLVYVVILATEVIVYLQRNWSGCVERDG